MALPTSLTRRDLSVCYARPYLEVIFTGVGSARSAQIILVRVNDAQCGIAMRKKTWVHREWFDAVMRTEKIRAVVLRESKTPPEAM